MHAANITTLASAIAVTSAAVVTVVIAVTSATVNNKLNIMVLIIAKPMFGGCEDCVICLETLKNDLDEFNLKCGHVFHMTCLLDYIYIRSTDMAEFFHFCPLCRHYIENNFLRKTVTKLLRKEKIKYNSIKSNVKSLRRKCMWYSIKLQVVRLFDNKKNELCSVEETYMYDIMIASIQLKECKTVVRNLSWLCKHLSRVCL